MSFQALKVHNYHMVVALLPEGRCSLPLGYETWGQIGMRVPIITIASENQQ